MNWLDIASIIFVCVTANHLGLVKAIETVTKCHRLPIIGCPKCLTGWVTVGYLTFVGNEGHSGPRYIVTVLAISFLASYAAIWLELFEGFIDTLFEKCYEKIYSNTEDNTDSSDTDNGRSAGSVS